MENVKEMRLYPEIKAAMYEVMTSEENGREWMKIAREQLADVKTLINAAKKISKDESIIPQKVIDAIREEIAAEKEAAAKAAAEADSEQTETPETPEEQ